MSDWPVADPPDDSEVPPNPVSPLEEVATLPPALVGPSPSRHMLSETSARGFGPTSKATGLFFHESCGVTTVNAAVVSRYFFGMNMRSLQEASRRPPGDFGEVLHQHRRPKQGPTRRLRPMCCPLAVLRLWTPVPPAVRRPQVLALV